MAKEKHMNVDTDETHLRLAMREIADIKAELSTLPESQAFSVNIDEYQNELKNITMQLSNKNNIQYTPHNNNDACMLLKQPHTHKTNHSTRTINVKLLILLSLLIFVVLVYVYGYMYIYN